MRMERNGAGNNMTKLEFFKEHMKGRILDVGCSSGKLHEALYVDGMYGLDLNPSKIKKNFHIGNAQNMPFEDSFFDTVIASELIEHLESPRKFIKECKRILKSDGILLIATPNVDSFYNTITGKYHHEWHKHLFDMNSITIMLKEEGFRITFMKIAEFDEMQTYIRNKTLFKIRAIICKMLPESLREDMLIVCKKAV